MLITDGLTLKRGSLFKRKAPPFRGGRKDEKMKNNATMDAIKKLEEGVQEVFKSQKYADFLKFLANFRGYSPRNTWLIWAQNPAASRVAGFKAWEKMGRNVKKGEKAIRILAPCPAKKTIESENGEEKEYTVTYFKPVPVFDVSQTDGKPLPEIVKNLTADSEEWKKVFAGVQKISPVPVEVLDFPDAANGYYSYIEQKIVVKAGLSPAQTAKTALHELTHCLLHGKVEKDRETKEVEAESVAFTVLNALGLDSSEYSFGYVAGWSSGRDAKELKASLETIQTTAENILKKLEEVQNGLQIRT